MSHPDWMRGGRVLIRAAWDGRPSEVPDLADSLLVLLRAVDTALGGGRPWNVDGVGPIADHDSRTFAELIRGAVERGDDGTAWPTHGYHVLAHRSGDRGTVSLGLRVGASIRGRRKPANSVTATVSGPDVDGVTRVPTVELVEAVLRGVVRAWDPDTAAAYDRDAARATEGAGRFAPIVGQRAWVARRVGTVETVTSGVTARPGAGGTYLDADDALDSASAALAVRASLHASGIETIPRRVDTSSRRPGTVLLPVEPLVRAFTRGRGGYRDDVQSAVVCAELRRLVAQGDLPRACWKPIRSAVHGTHMDSWSAGLPVDDRYAALWPLFEGTPPLLSDAESAAVDPEVAVAAVEYGVIVVAGQPRVVRVIPAEHEAVPEVWTGVGWTRHPDAEPVRHVSRSDALRMAGWPRPDAFG